MKKLRNLLKSHKAICFFDLEGSQYSHECIAIGAVLATFNKAGELTKIRPSFKVYVKPKNKIGKYVEQLTGITEDLLEEKGVSFAEAIEKLFAYLGKYEKNTLFISYGNHDMTILGQTIAYNLDAPLAKCTIIQKNYLDFQAIFNEYVKDDNNNVLSLVHACEMFEINIEEGIVPHDPASDSLLLSRLYQAFLTRKDIVFDRYVKVLSSLNNLPAPIENVVKDLSEGNEVSQEKYYSYIEETIKNI
ncbi:MAG: hypothetical protein LUB56_00845 [Coprobacillus sp.]|nr:hypothetical protein [Coprobacillus sp.]